MTALPGPDPVLAWTPDERGVPAPDPALEPEGYLVTAAGGVRIHFLDWGGPTSAGPGILLLPGLLQPAWSWAPAARRLARARHTVVVDLRGQGLSDAPADGYGIETLAGDAIAAAEGAGLLDGERMVVAGHGFGGQVAAGVAAALGDACAGLVLVDGGWERLEETTGIDVEEFLRGLDEPPEVLRSMDAYLADRRGFDPATWDADQERAARDAVVETAAGHVVRAVRPHVIDALVRTMFGWEPAEALSRAVAPVTALVALASGDPGVRTAELRRAAGARVEHGRDPIRAAAFPGDAHNLIRYRPSAVAAAVLAADR